MAAVDFLEEALNILAEAPPLGLTVHALWSLLHARLADLSGQVLPDASALKALIAGLARHPDVRLLRLLAQPRASSAAGDAADGAGSASASAATLAVRLRPERRMQTLGIMPLPKIEEKLVEVLLSA